MLDAKARSLLDMLAAAKAPTFSAVGPAVARKMHAALVKRLAGPAAPVASERNLTIPGPAGPIPVRAYNPGLASGAPVLIYFHGGGNVVGDLEMVEEVCRLLSANAGCLVVSVDYRLAPEHPYPGALDDAYAVATWLAAHATEIGGDAARLAVAGDSAGGTLSALVSRLARDRGGPALAFQGLIYAAGDMDFERPSMRDFAEGFLLTAETIRWFRSQYFPQSAPESDAYAWPLRGTDLAGLPPALVITAGFDPLQDSGIAYGKALESAGVPVRFVHYEDMVHGFFTYPSFFAQARAAADELAASLRAIWR